MYWCSWKNLTNQHQLFTGIGPIKNQPTWVGLSPPLFSQWKISILELDPPPPWLIKIQLTWVGLSPPPLDQWKISLLGLDGLSPTSLTKKISLLGLDSAVQENPLTLIGLSLTFLTNEKSAYFGWTLAHLSSPRKPPSVYLLASRFSCYSYSDHCSHHANYLQCHHYSSRHGQGFWHKYPWIITSHDILMHHCSTNFQ